MILSYPIIKIINNISFEKGNILTTIKKNFKNLKFGKLKFIKNIFLYLKSIIELYKKIKELINKYNITNLKSFKKDLLMINILQN